MKKIIAISLFVLSLAVPASAAEFQFAHEKNDTTVSVPASETHKNLYSIGAVIDINGNTLGDLFAAAAMVSVNGNVEKDLNVAGGNLNINGSVGDDLRAAGGNVSINGPVGTDLLVAGGNITVSQKATVGGDLVATVGNFIFDSEVKGKTQIFAGNATINGKIDGDLFVRANQGLIFGPKSEVIGKIVYEGPTPAVVKDGAKVGNIEFTKIKPHNRGAEAAKSLFAIATLIKLLALLIAGLVLYYLFPHKIDAVLDHASGNVWKNLGLGFLVLVVSPIVAMLFCVTVIGFYLGLIVFFLYFLTLILASVFMLFYTGNLVYKWYKKDGTPNHRRDLVIGAVILLIISVIPIIGGIVDGILFLIVLGAFARHLKQTQMINR